MIKINELTKIYSGPDGDVRALDGASVEVAGGEFVAVQGSSGCGKTTLLLTAGGLLMPTTGAIHIDGRDPYRLSANDRAQFRADTIGFVFQQFHLVPYLTVAENILAPSLAKPSAQARDRAKQLIDHFGLEHRTRHVPSELSTGERQRVALARALLNAPKVVLADEPTGNLDEENAHLVLGHLAEFARGGGAVLLVTHDIRAASFADRTLHMEAGTLSQS